MIPIKAGLLLLPFLAQDPAIRDLIESLRSDKSELREAAARKLKERGRAALPALQEASKDPDLDLSKRAEHLAKSIELLELLTPALRNAVPALEEKLAAAPPSEWTGIFLMLTGSEGMNLRYPQLRRRDLEPLASMAIRGAQTIEDLRTVCEVIGNRRLRSANGDLIHLLENPDPQKSGNAVATLVLTASEGDIPAFLALLDSKDAAVKELAQSFISSTRPPDVDPKGAKSDAELIAENLRLLQEPNERICEVAVMALGNLQATSAVPEILPLCRDPGERVGKYATLVVGMLGGKERTPDLLKLITYQDPEIAGMAIDMLVKIGARETAPEVAGLLEGKQFQEVRHKAIRALTEWRVKEQMPRILALLVSEDEDLFTRREAARAAGVFGIREATAAIRKLIDYDAFVAGSHAFPALLQLQGNAAIPWFIDGLKADNHSLRMQVLQALGSIPPANVETEVLQRLEDASPEVREAAAECLLRWGSRAGVTVLLEQSYQLLSLNRLTHPLLVKRLEQTPPPACKGRTRDLFAELARQLGLTLEWPDIDAGMLKAEFFRRPEVWRAKDWNSAWDTLNDLLLERYSAILEPGKIRIVTRKQAEEYWAAWLVK